MATNSDVAQWMLNEVLEKDYLEQGAVVYVILEKFGNDFVYQNNSGNLAIQKSVLSEFNKISAENVVWLTNEKAWCLRKEHHKPGRQQY
jgi:hypothetical protein